jgi:hypothetical protein
VEVVRRYETGIVMRIISLLAITFVCGIAGLIAGWCAYDFSHPIVPLTLADSIGRDLDRLNWLMGGAFSGAGCGFVGTWLARRLSRDSRRRERHEPDIPA